MKFAPPPEFLKLFGCMAVACLAGVAVRWGTGSDLAGFLTAPMTLLSAVVVLAYLDRKKS